MITAILIDDMPQAIEVLKKDLENNFSDIEIIGTAKSVVSGAKLLKQQQPDLLFLDIMLGDGTGFDLLEILPNLKSKVIFCTAYEEHAIKAFRFAAVDYLLKPIHIDNLKEAVERSRLQIQMSNAIPKAFGTNSSLDILKEAISNPSKLPERITLHTQEKIVVVEIKDIVRCESDGNNTIFHLISGQQIFVTKTLKQYEILFQDHPFLRTHQSHLVNTNYIQEYIRKEGGYLKMKNGDSVSVSVRKKSEVIALLDEL